MVFRDLRQLDGMFTIYRIQRCLFLYPILW